MRLMVSRDKERQWGVEGVWRQGGGAARAGRGCEESRVTIVEIRLEIRENSEPKITLLRFVG